MNHRKYLLISTLLLGVAAVYHVVDHVIWLLSYMEETDKPLSSEIVPLLFSIAFLLPPIFMTLLWQSKKPITPAYLWMMVIGAFLIIFSLYAGRKSGDSLVASFTLALVAVPIAIVITILAAMEWRKKLTS